MTCPQAESDLRHALERAGRRYTRQRAAVCAYLRSVMLHPTAEQVFAAVRREIPHISLGTVYKALEALVAAGVASRLDSAAGPARYDGRSEAHYHYRCDRTGEVHDLPLSYDPQLLEKIAPSLVDELRGRGFVVTGHRLELVGRFVPHK
jgi:Fur family peroxide stress response transcriptional regulator